MNASIQKQIDAIDASLQKIDAALKDLREKERNIGMIIEKKMEEVIKRKNLIQEGNERVFSELRQKLTKQYKELISDKIGILEKEKYSLKNIRNEFLCM